MLTVKEVSQVLRVSRATAYRLVETGELPHIRVSNAVRVNVSDLEAFVQAGHPVSQPDR